MKIEVIEKKREEAKETAFVVGGVYKHVSDGSVYVLTRVEDAEFAFTWVGATNDGWDHDQPDTYLFDEDVIRGFIGDYVYVPNARLVIDDSEGDSPTRKNDGAK